MTSDAVTPARALCLVDPKLRAPWSRLSDGLFYHRIMRHGPFMVRIVHHEIDEHGQQTAQQCCSIPYLCPVHLTVPGRSAVDELVAQNIHATEQDREDCRRVLPPQCSADSHPLAFQPDVPVIITGNLLIVMVPEGRKNEAVVEQQPDFLAEALPYHVIHAKPAIERNQRSEEVAEHVAFPPAVTCKGEGDVARISSIETDPEQHEADVIILFFRFCTPEPR